MCQHYIVASGKILWQHTMHCKRCDDHMNSICPKIKVPMELEVYCQLLFLNIFVSCLVGNTKTLKPSQLQLHMKSEESWLHLLTTWCLPTGYHYASHFHFNSQLGDLFIFPLHPPVSHSPWRWHLQWENFGTASTFDYDIGCKNVWTRIFMRGCLCARFITSCIVMKQRNKNTMPQVQNTCVWIHIPGRG
jgi:hypothetical protein